MSRMTRKGRLLELNTFDKDRIINENIDNLIAYETRMVEEQDWEQGSIEENEHDTASLGDSMAEVVHLMSRTRFSDDGDARIEGGPLYREGRD